MKSISNEQLRVEDLPSPGADWCAIQTFALTFDGYAQWGSFEKCAEIANQRKASTLTEMRTCLFFEQRRWRHFGEDPPQEDMPYMRDLIEKIRSRLVDKQLD